MCGHDSRGPLLRSSTVHPTLNWYAGLSSDAMRGMVQAFRKATKVKLHRDYIQNSAAAAAAIAAGSRARGDGGLPVNALDLSQCKSAAELHAEHFFCAIPALQCAPRACLSRICGLSRGTAGMRQQSRQAQ